jgi:GT2 family glycosyltransferase
MVTYYPSGRRTNQWSRAPVSARHQPVVASAVSARRTGYSADDASNDDRLAEFPGRPAMTARTTVVIATRDRAHRLRTTLHRLAELRPPPPVVVVDNASTDRTAAIVRAEFPGVTLIRSARNLGASARTLGVAAADTPFVAFSDDDSWWAPDALAIAERAMTDHPRLGLIAGRTLVGPENHPDPVTTVMAGSPLDRTTDPRWPEVLGFLACSCVVRTDAYLQAGGFSPLLHFVAEEKLLAYDLATAGWALCYIDEVQAHHHPATERPPDDHRRALELRNNLLIAWLRRPLPVALRDTARLARQSTRDTTALSALAGALRRLPAAITGRRPLPGYVERQVQQLETEHSH